MKIQIPHIQINSRNIPLTEAMRDHLEANIETLLLDYPRILEVHVLLDIQKHTHLCEMMIYAVNHSHFAAKHKSDNLYTSMDLCIEKLSRQISKYKTRMLKHRRCFIKHKPNLHFRSAQACTLMRSQFAL